MPSDFAKTRPSMAQLARAHSTQPGASQTVRLGLGPEAGNATGAKPTQQSPRRYFPPALPSSQCFAGICGHSKGPLLRRASEADLPELLCGCWPALANDPNFTKWPGGAFLAQKRSPRPLCKIEILWPLDPSWFVVPCLASNFKPTARKWLMLPCNFCKGARDMPRPRSCVITSKGFCERTSSQI